MNQDLIPFRVECKLIREVDNGSVDPEVISIMAPDPRSAHTVAKDTFKQRRGLPAGLVHTRIVTEVSA